MRHVIDAVAAQGRGDDTELLHVTKKELAGLDAFKRSRTGSGLPRNPRTGLKEAGWFDQYVAPALPAVAGLAAGAMTGGTMAAPAAALAGAATGAGIKGAQGASTQDVLMGGVMGGISGYGAGSLGAGLAGADAAATTGTTAATTSGAATPAADVATPAFNSGAESFGSQGVPMAVEGAPSYMDAAQSVAPPAETSPFAQFGGGHQGNPFQNIPNLAQETPVAQGSSIPNASTPAPASTPMNWNYLGSDKALSDATKIGTGTLGMYAMAPGDTTTDDTGVTVNKTLPKAEVYYTPYGERRTRIAAAEGGLMSMNGAYGDYDGAESGVGIRRYAGGGIANISAAKGRYLQGPGDGMSDSIPASIDGKQEARLATGEFVVSADVVSGLGNGDSTAGAKQLHKMMDRVRLERTGTKKQGKQINPRKVMPA